MFVRPGQVFRALLIAVACVAWLPLGSCPAASITELDSWQLVEDPPHPNFSTSVDSPMQVSLFAADGSVPTATDIGFQSIFGTTPGSATAGNFFRVDQNFSLALDYGIEFTGTPVGGLAIGFGIGEDSAGSDSAGVVIFTNNGASFASAGGARVDDNNTAAPLAAFPSLSGSLHVAYDAASGDVTVGTGGVGDNAPSLSTNFAGIANQWDGTDLLPSFFMRSDDVLGVGWSGGGTATATFSNLRVVSGSAVAVPEPSGLMLLGVASWSLAFRRSSLRTCREQT